MSTEYAQDRIAFTIKMLEDTIKKCDKVDHSENAKCDNTPAYLVGWCTSTLRNAVIDLKAALNDLN